MARLTAIRGSVGSDPSTIVASDLSGFIGAVEIAKGTNEKGAPSKKEIDKVLSSEKAQRTGVGKLIGAAIASLASDEARN